MEYTARGFWRRVSDVKADLPWEQWKQNMEEAEKVVEKEVENMVIGRF
jgi:hypothetical protein